MRGVSLFLALASAAGAVACGESTSLSGPSAHAGNAGVSDGQAGTTGVSNEQAGSAGVSTEQAGTAGVSGQADWPAVWNEQSQHIDIRCDSYHFGRQVLRGDREQMSPEQLDLLAQLTRTPRPGRLPAGRRQLLYIDHG